jgi:hypothetical protein
VIAGVVRINSIDVRPRLARNFVEDSFLKKPLPLPRNDPISGGLLGVGGSSFDSDNEKSW